MATYYWVGGSGTWDNSSKTNWATSTGGAGGFGPPLAADTVYFDSGSGTAAVVTVAATAVCTTCNINKSDINLSLSGSPTFGGTLTFTTGTITLNDNTLTVQIFSSSNSNARSIAFGIGNITVTGNNATVISAGLMTGFTYTGTPSIISNYSGSTGTRTIRLGNSGGASETNALSVSITAGSDAISIAGYFKNLIYSGYTGTATNADNNYVYGNLTLASGMTIAASATGFAFNATSGTSLVTTNGVTIDAPVGKSGAGATLQLQDNMTVGSTRTVTLTSGTLDLTGNSGNWTLSCGLFASNNSNTRSILFGTGNITLTGNAATIFNMAIATSFTYTGTPTINSTYSGATGTRTISFGSNSGGTEANAVSINVSAGTDTATIQGGFKNLVFTGFAGTLSNSVRTIYGILTLSAGMTLTAGTSANTFAGTSGTQTITSNGKTMDFPVTFNGVGGTFRLVDALSIGSTRATTLTNGTLDGFGQNVSLGTFALGSGTKTLTLGSGTWTVAGSGTAWDANTNVTGLTVSASTGTISMTSGSSKTFSGGGRTWPTLNQGGAGALTIAQSNTFANITDTVQPATVRLTAGTTQTVSALSLAGTSGNLITLDTTVAGTRATIFKASGSVSLSFVSIKDIAATGGANFNAFTSNGCVDGGNNTGWDFNSALYPTIYTVRKTKRYFLN